MNAANRMEAVEFDRQICGNISSGGVFSGIDPRREGAPRTYASNIINVARQGESVALPLSVAGRSPTWNSAANRPVV